MSRSVAFYEGSSMIIDNVVMQISGSSMMMLLCRFKEVVSDPDTKVVVLTGSDPYYCAGVNLSATIQPMHPKKLHNMIFTRSA